MSRALIEGEHVHVRELHESLRYHVEENGVSSIDIFAFLFSCSPRKIKWILRWVLHFPCGCIHIPNALENGCLVSCRRKIFNPGAHLGCLACNTTHELPKIDFQHIKTDKQWLPEPHVHRTTHVFEECVRYSNPAIT